MTARPGTYEIWEAEGRLGGGDWTLAGRILADEWSPEHVELDVELEDARAQFLDFLPRSTADASLRLDGPLDDLLLSGEVDIKDMTFAERIDWEEWVLELSGGRLEGAVAEEREDIFALDVEVHADETIRVDNNVGDFTASAELRLVGDSRRTGLVGDVRVSPGGRAYLKERDFEVLRGELRFIEPYAYDPEVDLSLRTEIATREQDYLIDYRVNGPWSDWRVDTSSSPGLPVADINALLLFGMTREELERYGLEGALAVETADLLASSLGVTESLSRLGGGIFGSNVYTEELFRLDRFDLVSGVDARGSNTVSSDLRFLVTGNLPWLAGSTLLLEQNVFRATDTFVGLEQRLAPGLYLDGYWAREQEGRYLSIGGAYGLDLQVRWEIE